MLRFQPFQALLVLALLFNSASNPVFGSPVMENCIEPPPGLVSWWPGDGNVEDIAGVNSGTLQNGATFAAGKVGQAFSFDGVNAFVNVPNSASIVNIRSAITVDMWVNPLPPLTSGGYVFSRRDPLVSESFSIGVSDDGSLGVVIRTTTTPYVPEVRSYASVFVSRPGVITFGQFHHIAVAADAATTGLVRAYVDGQEISLPYTYGPATLSGLFWSVSNLFIGQRQSSNTWEGAAGGRHYRGLIDEVEVYNRALSANEIQAIFSAGSAGKCKTPFDDEFDGPTLNPRWSWYNENPGKWSLTASPGSLRIIGLLGDMAHTCNNPVNLLLQSAPSGDFELVTKLSLNPTSNFQQGGLIIFNSVDGQPDLDNYVKIDLLWSSYMGGKNVEFLWETQGALPSWPWPYFAVSQSQPAFLKLAKSGTLYTGYYSSDGQNWTKVGSHTITTISSPKMGIFALTGLGVPGCIVYSSSEITVDFDFFHWQGNLYSISGQVHDDSNNPIPGVVVSANSGDSTITGVNGYYTITSLITGTYTITPTLDGYRFAPITRTVTVPPDATGQDFTGTSNSGYALLFDGLNDYVQLPDWNLNTLTLEARFKLANLQNYKGVINRENDIQLGVVGSKLHYVLELGGGNWVTVDSQQSLRDSVWYHVAVTYDGATMKIFINGELDNQRPASGSIFRDVCTEYWVIGATYGGPCHNYYEWFWSGTLDEIRVWDYARSQSEIQSTMNTLLTGNEAGLVGYWQFNEGEGQIAYDSSGHGRNGVLGSTANPDDNDPTWTIGGFYVLVTGPSSGATGVPTTTTEITATFSTSVFVPSLNKMTVLFSDGVSNITGTIEYDAAGKMMTFHPAYLVEGTTYTMTLTSGIVAASDPNTHLAQYQWRFITVGSKRDKLIATLRDLKSAINGKILQDADTVGFDFGLARELHKLKTWIDFLSIPANVVLMWTGKDAPHLFDNLDTFKDIVGKVGLAMKVDGVIDDTPSMEASFDAMVRSADEAYGGNPWLGIPFDLSGYQQYVKFAVMGTDSPMNSIPLMSGPVGTNPTILRRGTALDVRSDVTQKFDDLINELPNPLPSTLDADQLIAELKTLARSIRRSQWAEQDVTYNAYFPGGLRPQTLSLGVVAQDSKMSNALIHSAADNVEETARVAAMKTAVGGVKLALLIASASASVAAETIYLPIDLAMLPGDLADIADPLTRIDPQTMLDEHAYRIVLHYGQETSTVWRLANDVVSTVNYRVAHSTSAMTKDNRLSGASISVAGLQMPDVVMGVTRTIGTQTGAITVTNAGASPLRVTLNGQIVGPADSFGNAPVIGVFDSSSFVDIPVGVTVPLTFTYSALRSLSTELSGYEAQAFLNVLDMNTSALTTYGPWRAHFFAGTTDQLTTLNQQTATVPISGTLATGQIHEQLITLLPTTHRVRFVLSQSPSSDLDLHIYDTMGHHIGVNYTSMTTEVQIAGSTYSGNEAQTEWIEFEPMTGTQQLRIQVVGLDAGDATHYAVAAIQTPSLPAIVDTFPEYMRTRTSTLATTVSFTAREVSGQSGVTGVQVSPANLDDGQGHIIPSANITFAVPITTVAAGGEVPITGTISLPANPVESTYTGSILLTGRDAISGTPVTATIGLDLIYARLRLYLPIVLHQY